MCVELIKVDVNILEYAWKQKRTSAWSSSSHKNNLPFMIKRKTLCVILQICQITLNRLVTASKLLFFVVVKSLHFLTSDFKKSPTFVCVVFMYISHNFADNSWHALYTALLTREKTSHYIYVSLFFNKVTYQE